MKASRVHAIYVIGTYIGFVGSIANFKSFAKLSFSETIPIEQKAITL